MLGETETSREWAPLSGYEFDGFTAVPNSRYPRSPQLDRLESNGVVDSGTFWDVKPFPRWDPIATATGLVLGWGVVLMDLQKTDGNMTAVYGWAGRNLT